MSGYRNDLIVPYVSGKRVLDIGSVGQTGEYCLWNVLNENVASLVGVDLPDAMDTAEQEFNVLGAANAHANDTRIRLGNMETIDLSEKFEVVVAGDVLEHVSNQGLFLDNIRNHLSDGGKLIITTPNAKWPTVALEPNATHVLWHDIFTLKTILDMHNFKIEHWQFYFGNKPHYVFWKVPLVYRQSLFVVATANRNQ